MSGAERMDTECERKESDSGASLSCPYCCSPLAGVTRERVRLVVCPVCKRPVLVHPKARNFARIILGAEPVKGAISAHFLAMYASLFGMIVVGLVLMGVASWLGFRETGAVMEALRSLMIVLAIVLSASMALEGFLGVRTCRYIHMIKMPGESRGKEAVFLGFAMCAIGVGGAAAFLWHLLKSLSSLAVSLWQFLSG